MKANGGSLDVGTRNRCFKAGFGSALYQHVTDEEEFIRKFSARYAPLVEQKLWYKDSPCAGRLSTGDFEPSALAGLGRWLRRIGAPTPREEACATRARPVALDRNKGNVVSMQAHSRHVSSVRAAGLLRSWPVSWPVSRVP